MIDNYSLVKAIAIAFAVCCIPVLCCAGMKDFIVLRRKRRNEND